VAWDVRCVHPEGERGLTEHVFQRVVFVVCMVCATAACATVAYVTAVCDTALCVSIVRAAAACLFDSFVSPPAILKTAAFELRRFGRYGRSQIPFPCDVKILCEDLSFLVVQNFVYLIRSMYSTYLPALESASPLRRITVRAFISEEGM